MIAKFDQDYKAGRKARTHGIPFNAGKPNGWQLGWNDKNTQIAQLLREIGR